MLDLKYSEILALNRELGANQQTTTYNVSVISNVITTQINQILEYSLRLEGINAKVNSTDYDNIVQDSLKYNQSDLVLLFWESVNLIDGLQYKADMMSDDELDSLISKVVSEIDFVINNLKTTSLVIINKFSSLIFNHYNIKQNNLDLICDKLNDYLINKIYPNMVLIDIEKVLAKISISKSVDFRYYYSSKALYTLEFYKHYCAFIKQVITSVKGKSKKALIFDCDNTLWKGILGEDGEAGIEMSAKNKNGVVFEEIQFIAKTLSKKGILIGLCSKNNSKDVTNIIDNHEDFSLIQKELVIQKVNWNDKKNNLIEISKELNIGLDSIVFVDDSNFEIGLIKEELPEITLIHVPENLYEYPQLIRNSLALFYNISESQEDLKRTEMYLQQAKRTQEKDSHTDIDKYLASLSLEITIHLNPVQLVARISQLTQKTNQFNLTTKRYTESDITNFISSKDYKIFAFEVKDKYGDSGVTGTSIIKIEGKTAIIDTMLMSCRIIGRNIEYAFLDYCLNYLKSIGIDTIKAFYVKTFKNEQVTSFYDAFGFELINANENNKNYELKLANYQQKNINYIKIKNGKSD